MTTPIHPSFANNNPYPSPRLNTATPMFRGLYRDIEIERLNSQPHHPNPYNLPESIQTMPYPELVQEIKTLLQQLSGDYIGYMASSARDHAGNGTFTKTPDGGIRFSLSEGYAPVVKKQTFGFRIGLPGFRSNLLDIGHLEIKEEIPYYPIQESLTVHVDTDGKIVRYDHSPSKGLIRSLADYLKNAVNPKQAKAAQAAELKQVQERLELFMRVVIHRAGENQQEDLLGWFMDPVTQ